MANTSTRILSIYKARTIILELLEHSKYAVSEYLGFNIIETDAMFANSQLDMLITHEDTVRKVYVKFYISKVIKPQNIYDIVEDLFHLESVLEKKDDLIVIIKDEPNETMLENIKDIWVSENIYISLINIKRLQFNILKHVLVPKHTILSNTEKELFMKKYNIFDKSQIPDISYFSPVSIVMGIRPDDVVKIERASRTSINAAYYRICKLY